MKCESSDLPADVAWRFLDELADVLMLRVDANGQVLEANRFAIRLTGLPLVGLPWHAMQLNMPGERVFTEWLQSPERPRLLNVTTMEGLPQTFEIQVAPMGREFLIFGQTNPAEQARMRREVLALNHELNNVSRERAVRNAELADLNALKNQFLGMATHDLRKPAGVILGYAEILREDAGRVLTAEQREMLETIYRAADRMRLVIDDFLDASLIEAGQFPLNLGPADLNELTRHARTLVSIAAAKRRVHVTTDLDPSGTHIQADGPKLEQVLTNLLSNAVEHSPLGGTVRIRSERRPSDLRVEVADEGPGVPTAQRAQLFQAFSRGQTAKPGGDRSVGLGLAISRKIIEAHGGLMFVEDAPSRGAIFGFTLPVQANT